jgi:cobalt-zinc-cadmium efflux system membrane fusion protein
VKLQSSIDALFALVFAVCVLVALLLLTGCKDGNAVPLPPGPVVKGESITFPATSSAALRFEVEKVMPPGERDLVLPGRLVWNEERTVRVFPPFAGRVTRIVANVGDRVAAGQPLAEIVSPDFGQAQADALKAKADLALAERTLARTRELKEHGVAAAKDLQQAEADDARAEAEADRAVERVQAYGQPMGSGARFVLKSPMSGTVVERNLNPGQDLRPDQPGAPLFVVTDPSHLWASLDAHEGDLRYLHAGAPIAVESNQLPDQAFAGSLRQLSDFVDPVTRTVKLRGDVPNPARALKAEMFISARIHLPKADLPSVDARAVYLSGARRYVFLRTDGFTFTRRQVEVGAESDGRMAIRGGLREGDEVVTSGNLFLEQLLANHRTLRFVEERMPAS